MSRLPRFFTTENLFLTLSQLSNISNIQIQQPNAELYDPRSNSVDSCWIISRPSPKEILVEIYTTFDCRRHLDHGCLLQKMRCEIKTYNSQRFIALIWPPLFAISLVVERLYSVEVSLPHRRVTSYDSRKIEGK